MKNPLKSLLNKKCDEILDIFFLFYYIDLSKKINKKLFPKLTVPFGFVKLCTW